MNQVVCNGLHKSLWAVLVFGLLSLVGSRDTLGNPDASLREKLGGIICACYDKDGREYNYNIRTAAREVRERRCIAVKGPNAWVGPIVRKHYTAAQLKKFCMSGLPSAAPKTTSSSATNTRKSNRKSSTTRSKVKPVRPKPKTRVVGSVVDNSYNPHIDEASERYQIPSLLIRAVIRVESSGKPTAESSAGAQGLMQLMPATAKELGVTNSFDARQNIMGGTKYLRRLADHYSGDIVKTLAAYHAGHRAVDEIDGIPYAATKRYVKKVLSQYYGMKGQANAN